jgi:hypothetical protein
MTYLHWTGDLRWFSLHGMYGHPWLGLPRYTMGDWAPRIVFEQGHKVTDGDPFEELCSCLVHRLSWYCDQANCIRGSERDLRYAGFGLVRDAMGSTLFYRNCFTVWGYKWHLLPRSDYLASVLGLYFPFSRACIRFSWGDVIIHKVSLC